MNSLNKQEKILLGNRVLNVVLDSLRAGCDTVDGVVAGGVVRDLWAEQKYGIDLAGSGDVDLCIYGLAGGWTEATSTLILQALQEQGFEADWDRLANTSTSSFNSRTDAVFQMVIEGVNFDIMMYKSHFETVGQVMSSFNCSLNRFCQEPSADTVSIINYGFCPKNPEFVYTEQEEIDLERHAKMKFRWAQVRKAHLAESTDNPYANIRG